MLKHTMVTYCEHFNALSHHKDAPHKKDKDIKKKCLANKVAPIVV